MLKFYSDLKNSVEGRLGSVRSAGFDIQIDASFVVDRDFRREFPDLIDKRKKGPYGEQDASQQLSQLVSDTDWSGADSVVDFAEALIERMKLHKGEQLAVSDQAYNAKELYDYVFSLEYLSSRYELRLDKKKSK